MGVAMQNECETGGGSAGLVICLRAQCRAVKFKKNYNIHFQSRNVNLDTVNYLKEHKARVATYKKYYTAVFYTQLKVLESYQNPRRRPTSAQTRIYITNVYLQGSLQQ